MTYNRGHIRKRSSNSYEVKIYTGIDKQSNKKIYKYFSIKGSEKDAQKLLTEKLREMDSGLLICNDKMLFGDYLDYWFKQCCVNKLSQNTCDGYEKKIRIHIKTALGNYKLQDLLPLHLQAFYTSKEETLSSTTVLQMHAIIHKALKQAMKWQLVSRNVADFVEKPKKAKYTPKFLTEEQIKELIKVCEKSNLYIPIMIGITTGMRRGEILGLTWDNVDLENSTIIVTQALYKTSKGIQLLPPKSSHSYRKITIPQKLTDILIEEKNKQNLLKEKLKDYYIDNNFVCCKENGECINPDSFTPAFNKLIKKNNLYNIRFHDLRHTHASILLKQNFPPKVIAERLGHSNIKFTLDTYSHVYDSTNIEVANKINMLIA